MPLTRESDIIDVNADLALISRWADQWRVVFNASKTQYMIFSKKSIRPPPISIFFNGTPIEQVRFHCHLGVWFTDTMTWEKHTREIVNKTSRSLNLLKRMSSYVSRKTKLSIYKTYLRPKMEYATSIFDGNLTKNQIDNLENIQRQALLCALNAYKHTSHDKLLKEAGIEPLAVRRRYFGLCHLYKIINRLAPIYLYNLLPPRVQGVSTYPLRNMQDFSIPRANKNYIILSFFWQFLHLWNALDLNIQQLSSLSQFKAYFKASSLFKENKLFTYFSSKSSTQHSRMRMGLSALNAQRRAYNFIQHDSCPLCGFRPEDTVHFFLTCPKLAILRQTMMRDISNIFTEKLPFLNVHADSRRIRTDICEILLNGSSRLLFEENVTIFKAVIDFIGETKRFDIN